MKPTLAIFFLLFTFACSENKNGQNGSPEVSEDSLATAMAQDSAAEKFFPVLDFMRAEIRAVDSLPIGIKVYRTEGAKKDSGYLKSAEFHQLTDQFLTPELERERFKKSYKESSFYDRTNKKSTFYYETKSQDATIRRIDIITSATDTYDKVTNVYIEKVNGNQQDLKKLIWKPGQEFSIIEPNKVTRVVWQY